MADTNHHEVKLVANKFEPSHRLKTASIALIAIGALGFLIGLMQNPDRLWAAYLVAVLFV